MEHSILYYNKTQSQKVTTQSKVRKTPNSQIGIHLVIRICNFVRLFARFQFELCALTLSNNFASVRLRYKFYGQSIEE